MERRMPTLRTQPTQGTPGFAGLLTGLLALVLLMGAMAGCSSDPTSDNASDETSKDNASDSAPGTTAGSERTVDPDQPFEALAPWQSTTGSDGRVYVADKWGRALQFRGVNIKTHDPAADVTPKLLDAIRARGFNHIRLSVFWDLAEPTQGTFDEAYLDAIDGAIERAATAGLWVIVDFHQDTFGGQFSGDGKGGMPKWATITNGQPFEDTGSFITNYLQPAVQEAWENLYENPKIRAWQEAWYKALVTRVAEHPNIFGYDLLNEPFGKLRPGEDLAAAASRVESKQITPMYQRLTDVIRTIDTQRWIMIEPPNVASLGVRSNLGVIDDDRVIFYPHMYDASIEGETYNGSGTPETFDPGFIDKWSKAVAQYPVQHKVPMMVGEWGVAVPENPEMSKFIAVSLAELDKVASGWSQFTGCLGEGYCTFGADGTDRPGIGQVNQPYASAIAGTPSTQTWNPETSTLTLSFTTGDASAPGTELVIPEKFDDLELSFAGDAAAVLEAAKPAGDAFGVTRRSLVAKEAGTNVTVCLAPAGSTCESAE